MSSLHRDSIPSSDFLFFYTLIELLFVFLQQLLCHIMNVQIEESWKRRLEGEFEKPYFQKLTQSVRQEYMSGTCYPPGKQIFNAFQLCPFEQVKVVIIGQDPYHEPGQAHGLSFSVQDGVPFPPSLYNIFKEIEADLGTPVPTTGDLSRWARQGVLLLNATLTVRAHAANSHATLGWQNFTDAAIQALATHREHLVYMLWGGFARSKSYMINKQHNLVLESVHPSPLSANRGGWFGQHQFSRCNEYLQQNGIEPIQW
jgi:uracil-DNA glycosylase